MLSVASMSGGQAGYYAGLAREDYYLAGGEPPGVWIGNGASQLGLTGKIDRNDFLDIFDGFKDGKALVQSAGQDNHRPGWDLTFSAPKSVSTAWSQADQKISMEIQAGHQAAVEKAIGYLEENALWTRRGRGGKELERAQVVVATFEHGTSRAQDPQLHTHALLLNVSVRADGSTGTLETQSLYEHKMAAGAIYRAELTRQLHNRLGFTFTRERSWFEVDGVSKDLSDEFSKRRHEIEAALREKGLKSSKAAEIAALDSRVVKEHVAREVLQAKWRAVGKEYGWGPGELQKIVRGPQPEQKREGGLEEAVRAGIEKIIERQSYFTEKELVRFVAEEAQTLAVGADAVLKKVKNTLQNSPEMVRLGIRFKEAVFTTQDVLRTEKALMNSVFESRNKTWAGATGESVNSVLAKRETITEEQAKAVRHITQGSGTIATITGMAGTGKTFTLEAARETFELLNCRVVGAAPTGKAARGLKDGAKIESYTIAKLLKDLGKPDSGLNLDSKTVLVVDEAAMVGTVQMKRIVDACGKAGAKLVLVGDEKQLQPIAAGGPFAAISKELGTVTLSEIIRQREAWQRKSVTDLAHGKSSQALREYAERGLVSVAKDRDQAKAELLMAWNKSGMAKPDQNLILAATNLDVVGLNREIQSKRRENGFVKGPEVKVAGESFGTGDRVLFTRNSRAFGVENGSLGTVTDVSQWSDKLTVRLDGGEMRSFSTRNYQHLKLGYAVTTHKAQGMTAENVFVLTSETMQDRELSYVQASRGKGETRFFTTESEAGEEMKSLSKRMAKSHQKEMAVEARKTFDHSTSIER